MAEKELYAEVILPLAVEGTFTYAIPGALSDQVKKGVRVLIQFGKKKLYSAVVYNVTKLRPKGFNPKQIISVLDDSPIVNTFQFQLWEWMAAYYMCSLGEVMKAALPAGLKLESESRIRVNRGFDMIGEFSYQELLLYEIIKDHKTISVTEIESIELEDNPVKILKGLLDKGAVETGESILKIYKPRTEIYLRLTEAFADDGKLTEILDRLKKAPKQAELLELLLMQMEEQTEAHSDDPNVSRRLLIEKGGSPAAITSLIKKGIIESIEKEEISGTDIAQQLLPDAVDLSKEQELALADIENQFGQHQTVLLQGVTSSGKTELYSRVIRETIEQGRQVLYLLPEIALTAQMVKRLKKIFGDQIGVYHSKFSDADRIQIYRNLAGLTDQKSYNIILGVRSSLFLPFQNLGLIIVDEEHENSYKQNDPAPRYHARDAANILALFHQGKVLLGTATPSFETYYNAKRKKFGYTKLSTRYGNVELPEIIIANSREAKRKKQLVSHFTPELMKAMGEALKNSEQIMLFQNRRGYTNFIICDDCGHIPRCTRCDVSLTYHKFSGKLECHYCGAREPMHQSCGNCAQTNLIMKGFGTEKIEDELAMLFEGIKVGRLDTDSASTRKGFEKIVQDFASGQIDILVGTQLISKGFDFENVSLVGVLDADAMLNFPDFRSFERSYQLISQVSGRAGRREKRGKVIIQTADPNHPVIGYVRNGDYEGLFQDQMEERQQFGYPPYIRMIRLLFKHKVPSILDSGTDLVAKELKRVFGSRVLGPQFPPIRKIQDQFHKQLYLKIEREASFEKAKSIIREKITLLDSNPVYRNIRVNVDVDPL